MMDAVALLQSLILCKTVTPAEGGALTLLEKILSDAGFDCHRLLFTDKNTPDVDNLYARIGTGTPHFCFAGHTDVVPTGAVENWSFDPFGGEIIDGYVCGRGAADMKSGVACSVAAAVDYLKEFPLKGSISFLITGDEEAAAINGTVKMIDWLEKRGEKIDFCLLGEPSSSAALGDMMKIGRRGTLSGYLTVDGVQGHVAYQHLADNPIPKMMKLLQALDDLVLDTGTAHFDATNLEIVQINIDNKAENVIPAQARAVFNVRFNDTYTGQSLSHKLRETLDRVGTPYKLDINIGGECFYTAPGAYSEMVSAAVQSVTGRQPKASTTGGTSDARFIRQHCPVIEFGLRNETIHKVDERVETSDVRALKDVYIEVLKRFFSA